MRNFFQFKKHMKKLFNIGLSLILIGILLFFSCIGDKKELDNYKKKENLRNDTIKHESIKIQTH